MGDRYRLATQDWNSFMTYEPLICLPKDPVIQKSLRLT